MLYVSNVKCMQKHHYGHLKVSLAALKKCQPQRVEEQLQYMMHKSVCACFFLSFSG